MLSSRRKPFDFFPPLFHDRKQQKPGLGSITFPTKPRAEKGSMAWGEQGDRSFNEGRAQPGERTRKDDRHLEFIKPNRWWGIKSDSLM